MNNASKIVSFTNLDAWKYGHKLVLITYEITKGFPMEKIMELAVIVHKLLNGLIKGARRYT